MNLTRLEQVLSELSSFVDQQSQFWDPGEVPSDLFHYTSPEGFIGIVRSKSIWASDMLSLNDASEANYAMRLTAELLDKYHPNVPDVDRQRFKTQLTDYMFPLYTPFVACFCRDGDLLSQWKGYGSGGEGFALGFSFRWLSSLENIGFRLQKVIYDRAQQEDLILMHLTQVSSMVAVASFPQEDQSRIWQGAAMALAPWVVMFKDPTFAEEREWRLVNVNMMPTLLYRRSGHRIVPYVEIPITDATAITRVIRGPYFAGTDARGAYLMLVSHGFVSGATVLDSVIPLRR